MPHQHHPLTPSHLPLPLLLLLLTLILCHAPRPGQSLECVSSICFSGEYCTAQCVEQDSACVGAYYIDHLNTVVALHFECAVIKEENCSTTCNPTVRDFGVHSCCCTTDFCNWLPGVVVGYTPPVSVVAPPTPPGLIPTVPEGHLVCAEHICTATGICELGYQVCMDHPDAPLDPDLHFCVSRYRLLQADSTLYAVEFKGCDYDVTGCTDLLDTTAGADVITSCCQGFLCNLNNTFTNSALVVHEVSPCHEAGCEHSCIVRDGEPACLCRVGFGVDSTDPTTCVDIDECLDPNVRCEYCSNTLGSYECTCPILEGKQLSADGITCESAGLVCTQYLCNDPTLSECAEPTVQVCADRDTAAPNDRCYTLATLNADNSILLRTQSCFGLQDSAECGTDTCILRRLRRDLSDVILFDCCCDQPLCNDHLVYPNQTNFTVGPTLTPEPVTSPTASMATSSPPTPPLPSTLEPGIIVLSVVGVAAVVFVLVTCMVTAFVFVYCKFRHKRIALSHDLQAYSTDNEPLVSTPSALEFIKRVGQGRKEAVVWQAREVGGAEVAVKRFLQTSRDSFIKEAEIYTSPGFRHSNVLAFIRVEEGQEELRIVMQYHPRGSLYDVLKGSSCTLQQFVTFAESAAAGVVHLHSEERLPSGHLKPAIAHRDLKSKNILVKSDGTCCISDFDLAIKFDSEVSDSHGQVGTLRYMAPEVLDGAISFQTQAFKLIDIYALSIIIYEITTRTTVPNDTSTVGEYRPPFDEVVSPNPTVEEMKQQVVTLQYRPPMPKAFRVTSELDVINKTIQESWDSDPESRLSAECIVDRLRTFRLNRFGAEISKDSGFAPLDVSETPQPQTPSLSSGATLSPLESKAMSLTSSGARLCQSQSQVEMELVPPSQPPPVSLLHAFGHRRGNHRSLLSGHSTETTV